MGFSLRRLRSSALIIFGTTFVGAAFLQCVGDDPSTSSDDAGGSDASVGNDSSSPDATSTSDGSFDAGPNTCAWDKTFNAPVLVDGLPGDGGAAEGHPSLSPDELTMYFHGYGGSLSDAGNTTGTRNDLYVATRKVRTDPFGVPTKLPISTNYSDTSPSISSDGTTLYYDSSADGGAFSAIWVAKRSSSVGGFTSLNLLPSPPASPQSGVSISDGQPFITNDNVEFWFTSRRDAGTGAVNIYRSQLSGGTFGAAADQTTLDSDESDYDPSLSFDRLTIYISSGRPGGGGGADDIWRSHRGVATDPFPAPSPVIELNSAANDFGGWLSEDNCRYYFESGRDGSGLAHIYMAERTP